MIAAIFDMDGLLIDSEPFWQAAEKKAFRTVGIDLTTDMCLKTMGRRTDEVVAFWFRRFPWEGKSLKQVEFEIVGLVKEMIENKGSAMDGVYDTLKMLKDHQFRIALASSSSPELIQVVLHKLRIGEYFEVVHSAEKEKRGKPDPAVYLTTADKMHVNPSDCVVFEDSLAGVKAGKAAGMKVIAIPAPDQTMDNGFKLADIKLRSLTDFSLEMVS